MNLDCIGYQNFFSSFASSFFFFFFALLFVLCRSAVVGRVMLYYSNHPLAVARLTMHYPSSF